MTRTDEQLKADLDQINQFWKWWKGLPVPPIDQPEAAFTEITSSAAALYAPDKPLLSELLMTGINLIEADWKQRLDQS